MSQKTSFLAWLATGQIFAATNPVLNPSGC
jgi:hypothetical protein